MFQGHEVLACIVILGGSVGFDPLGGLGGAGLLPTLGLLTKDGLLGSAG